MTATYLCKPAYFSAMLTLVSVAIGTGCSSTDNGAANTAAGQLGASGSSSNGGASATGGAQASSAGATTVAGGAGSSVGGGSNSAVPTWTQLYNNYFGAGTAGDCVSCHGAGTSPPFNSAATLCTTLKNQGFIGSGTATLQNLLIWFGGNGNMPQSGGAAPANAVSDITAWQNASAVCP